MSTTISGTTGIDKVQDGTTINASSIMGALNATGTAPIYACRAWVNFNGTGTVAIRASGNVSSITDNAVGKYTVNFITSMEDSYYSISGMTRQDVNDVSVGTVSIGYQTVLTPSSFKVDTGNDSGTKYDMTYVTLQVCR